MYLNHKFGDTQRSKFIFMTYVPDSLGGIKKSRVVGHRPPVEKMLKYIHLQWHILDKGEMRRYVVIENCISFRFLPNFHFLMFVVSFWTRSC